MNPLDFAYNLMAQDTSGRFTREIHKLMYAQAEINTAGLTEKEVKRLTRPSQAGNLISPKVDKAVVALASPLIVKADIRVPMSPYFGYYPQTIRLQSWLSLTTVQVCMMTQLNGQSGNPTDNLVSCQSTQRTVANLLRSKPRLKKVSVCSPARISRKAK